jgi:hypothetical protein
VRDYPEVKLEVTTDDSRVDLVAAGYDAGIQFGEYLAQDMIAVRVSPDLRPAIVAAPSYFAAHPRPTSPRDVLDHRCIRFRHRGESVYKWEFDRGDESMAIAVDGPLLLDELDLVIDAALAGAGLAWVSEDRVADHLASGALVRVLDDWCPPFPGFFLFYPTRKQQPAALTALIRTLRFVEDARSGRAVRLVTPELRIRRDDRRFMLTPYLGTGSILGACESEPCQRSAEPRQPAQRAGAQPPPGASACRRQAGRHRAKDGRPRKPPNTKD